MPIFFQHGIEELWVRAGMGDTTRYVPLHILFQRLGGSLCAVLPAVHSLTGYDIHQQSGYKKAALKAEPQKHFGSSPSLSPPILKNAELYLIKVLNPRSDASNFSEFQAELLHLTKGSYLHNLHLTSQRILPHIKRSFYDAYTIMHSQFLRRGEKKTSVKLLQFILFFSTRLRR